MAGARRQAEFLGLPLDENRLDGPGGRTDASTRTRSQLERDFLRLCRRRRLPEPEVNVPLGRYQVDVLWREERLIVETDGWAAHRGRAAFEHDHRRQAELAAAGYEVLRFTWRQVSEEPDSVLVALRRRLTGSSRHA